ncbi:MAG: radical SAM family heme chaperone HemW [Pseudarcicella sp.]|nr:radical SAM family heme chaperone HemW [Pseudarcicella sp.]
MHLYIHIPFCKQACHYCDFHFSTSMALKNDMIDSICKEIILQKDYLKNKNLETIYFGGGTPSLLNENDFDKIFNTIYQYFSIDKNVEITIEANPDDLNDTKLKLFKKMPINRFSIGIQSFNQSHLATLNRAHNHLEAKECVQLSQDRGFENISIDLIYGIPAPNHDIWKNDLEIATSLNVPHISAYCLTIEPKTAFGNLLKKGKMSSIDEQFAIEQYKLLTENLALKHYEQYEISNFAKEKKYSKHNTSYWKRDEYLGIGPSAHSYNWESRQFNISNNAKYIQAIQKNKIPAEIDYLSPENKANEYIMTGLRTCWGIDTDVLKSYNQTLNAEILNNYLNKNLIVKKENKILLSETGKLFADQISADLFFDVS